MKYIKLGSSDLNVSRICMGCMGFGEAGNGQHSWTCLLYTSTGDDTQVVFTVSADNADMPASVTKFAD